MNARSYGIYYMKGQNKHSFISVEKHMFDQWMNRNYVGSKGNIGMLKEY